MNTNHSETEASRKLVRGFYEAAASGDVARLMSCVDEKVKVIEPPFLFYGGQYEGVSGFHELFSRVSQYMDVTSIKVESLVADGAVVVVFMSARLFKENSLVQLCERSIVSNGKIVEMKIFYFDAASLMSNA